MEIRNILFIVFSLLGAGLIAGVVYMMENEMPPFDSPAPVRLTPEERLDRRYQTIAWEYSESLPVDLGAMAIQAVSYDEVSDTLRFEVLVKPEALAGSSRDLVARRAAEFFTCDAVDNELRTIVSQVSVEHVLVDAAGTEVFRVPLAKGSCG